MRILFVCTLLWSCLFNAFGQPSAEKNIMEVLDNYSKLLVFESNDRSCCEDFDKVSNQEITVSECGLNGTINRLDTVKPVVRFTNFVFKVDSSRHQHTIDLNFPPRNTYESALGYNYRYQINYRFGVNFRLGLWYKVPQIDLLPWQRRHGFYFSLNSKMDLRIWKTIYLEGGPGYSNNFTWPTVTNTIGPEGPKLSLHYFLLVANIRVVLFDHLTLRYGIQSVLNPVSGKWMEKPLFSVGYKF